MQNQPIEGDPRAEEDQTQRLVLDLVTDKQQRPWSLEELTRSLHGPSRPDIEDAVYQLQTIGLINRADKLIFASQAAAHIDRLGMLTL